MRTRLLGTSVVSLLCFGLSGCGKVSGPETADGGTDAATVAIDATLETTADAGVDAHAVDAATVHDAGPSDAGRDGGRPDSGARDAGTRPDAGPPFDAGPIDAAATAPGNVGAPCADDPDCPGLACLMAVVAGSGSLVPPGGYCTTDCTPGPTDSCPFGSGCWSLAAIGGGGGLCMRQCETDGDCRASEGYGCNSGPGGGVGAKFCFPP